MEETETKVLSFKHDIRNPLYIAKSLIETHLETITQEEIPLRISSQDTKEVLEKSILEIDRALATIRKLHGITRSSVQANGCGQVRRKIQVGEVLERVIQALRAEHYLEPLILVESIPRDLPAIPVNQIDLEEIFYNLIVNAAQAMPEGGTLKIDAYLTSNVSRELMISFRDRGCGISEEALPYIFEPFYTGRSKEGGTGFGLYIVKQLVQRNAGRITVESRVGGGTTFRLFFPVKTGED